MEVLMSDFARRPYQIRSDGKTDLAKQKIEVAILVDGKIHTRIQARMPGLTAVIGREDGSFDIEIVEQGGKRYTDVRAPEDTTALLKWQREALER
jgi:hypothetical protein